MVFSVALGTPRDSAEQYTTNMRGIELVVVGLGYAFGILSQVVTRLALLHTVVVVFQQLLARLGATLVLVSAVGCWQWVFWPPSTDL